MLSSLGSIYRRGLRYSIARHLSIQPSAAAVTIEPRLDFKWLVANEDEFHAMAQLRNSACDTKQVVNLYKETIQLRKTIDDQIRDRKQSSKHAKPDPAHIEKLKQIKLDIQTNETKLMELKEKLREEALRLPNTTHPDTPVGPEENAVVVNATSQNPKPETRLSHLEIGTKLDLFDFEGASKTTGSKFVMLRNDAALLELAIVQWVLTKLRAKHGFTPMLTPDLAQSDIVSGCGFQPRGESSQIYNIASVDEEDSNMCLVGTSEIVLGGSLANQLVPESGLPNRIAGFSHCFRMEAGSGSAAKGLYRLHQFSKVEMFSFTTDDQSSEELDRLRSIQEEICEELGLHWRTLDMPTEELGGSAHRKYDIEVWMPSRGGFGEVASISNCTDYQSRRLNIRYKPTRNDKRKLPNKYVHTLNGTGCAVPRLILALLETHQNEAGDAVNIPEVLVPFMGGKKTICAP